MWKKFFKENPEFISRFNEVIRILGNVYHSHNGAASKYHLEDNLLTHTLLVLEQIDKLINKEKLLVGIKHKHILERDKLKILNEKNLFLAGLLHDIGKYLTEQIVKRKNGERKIFNGHDYAGALLALDYLPNNLTKEEIELIVKSILLHTQAHSLKPLEEKISKYNYDYLSLAELYALYILEYADTFGRITLDNSVNEADKEKYEKLVTEYEKYLEKSKNYEKELHIFFGVPGTGKTTMRKKLIEKYGEENVGIVSSDDILEEYAVRHGLTYSETFKLFQENKELAEYKNKEFNKRIKMAKEKPVVIVDMTNLTKKSRRNWLNTFQHRKRIVHIFVRPYSKIIECRKDKVEEKVITDMLKKTTVPSKLEEKLDEVLIHVSTD